MPRSKTSPVCCLEPIEVVGYHVATIRRWLDRNPGRQFAAVAIMVTLACAPACSSSGSTAAEVTTTTIAAEPTTTTEVPLSGGKAFSVYVPTVGHCFDTRTGEKTPTIYLDLNCDLPHRSEVFAIANYSGKDWPGVPTLESLAKSACPASWEAYVAKPYETSMYELNYLLPQESAWGNGIRHVIGCLIEPPGSGRIAGSARGTAR